MSVKLWVFLRDSDVPTQSAWQDSINRSSLHLLLPEFSPRDLTGFLPCSIDGAECGFEYFLDFSRDVMDGQEPDEEDEHEDEDELRTAIGDRDRVIQLVTHGGRKIDSQAQIFAAASLANMVNGVFYDPQGGDFAIGRAVFDIIRQSEEDKLERGRSAAEKDAALTDLRCPHCGAPCPSYRKTCKPCGQRVGRV
jgi:hypothetical protein